MKVLYLFNDYLALGGEALSVQTAREALAAHGIDVELLTVDNEQLSAASTLKKARTTFGDREVRREVTSAIRRFRPDIVHAENLFPTLGRSAIAAVRDHQLPWVRTLRNYRRTCLAATHWRDNAPCFSCSGMAGRAPGVIHACYQGSRANSLGAMNYALWEAQAERSYPPDRFIAVSAAVAEAVRDSLGGVAVDVVHNAVRANADWRRCWGERRYDVVYVGRLSPEKGFEMVEAVVAAFPSLRTLIVGDGPLSHRLSRLFEVSPNLEWERKASPDRVAQVLADTRVALVPSTWEEPFGRVAAEALAAGSAPIVSHRGGLPEIVEGLDARLVMESQDPADWTERTRNILGRPPVGLDAPPVGLYERSLGFSPNRLAERLIEIYTDVLSQSPRRGWSCD